MKSFQIQPEVLCSLYDNFLHALYRVWTDFQFEIAMIKDIFIRMVGGLLNYLHSHCCINESLQ